MTLEKLGKLIPIIASLCSVALLIIVAYMAQAIADHDKLEKPHPIAATTHERDKNAHLLMQREFLERITENLSEKIAQKVVSKLKEHGS